MRGGVREPHDPGVPVLALKALPQHAPGTALTGCLGVVLTLSR